MRGSLHVDTDDCGVGVVCVGSAGVGVVCVGSAGVGAVNVRLSGISAMLQCLMAAVQNPKKMRSRDGIFLGFIFRQRTEMRPTTIRNVACFFKVSLVLRTPSYTDMN